jgi:hypothetical protein
MSETSYHASFKLAAICLNVMWHGLATVSFAKVCPTSNAFENHRAPGAFVCRSVNVRESDGTVRSSNIPSGQRTLRAVMGNGLVTTSVAEFCDQ